MKEKLFLFFIFILFLPLFVKAHNTNIGGVINNYASGIQQISPTQLKINQISLFNVNDTVFVYQAQGAIPYLMNDSSFGNIQNIANAGNYDFSIIQSIDVANKIITLSCPLLNNYNDNLFQVVKVKTYTNATVNSTLTCDPWDGTIGGVLVMFVNGTLTMNANIDVSGKGFRGANSPKVNVLNKCSNEATGGIYNYFYTANGYDSAGLKGESIVLLPFNYKRGRGKIINGGGGGNGINSAGGGGSHAGKGGNGGRESNACSSVFQNYGGIGGLNIFDVLNTNTQKLFFGGGGGTGTYEQYPTDVSKGGNGGGIAIIIASKIIANNYQIMANGESVTQTTTYESAGGGGGGGTVAVFSPNLNGNITLSAKGGNGGSSDNISCRGSGGGGGGGVVYHTFTTGTVLNVSHGSAGNACNGYRGTNGEVGIIRSNPFFSFNCLSNNNVIQANQSICPGFQPNLLTGTTSPYFISYEWQFSTDFTTWQTCSGVNNQPNYQPDTLYQTTYFRRIVININGSIPFFDTSNIVIINVSPLIINVNSSPVSCFGQNNGSASVYATGGSGIYSYMWSNGNTTYSINNLPAGVYFVTVSDDMGCSAIHTINIHQPPQFILSISKTDVSCNGGSNGTATVYPSGGVPPYTYVWSNGDTTQTITGLSANNYNVTVYDNNGCTANITITISQPQPITLYTTVTNATCPYLCNGVITLNTFGGTPPYTINPANLNDLCPSNYVITVTDANNCSITTTSTISVATTLQNNVISLNQSQACINDSVTIMGSVPTGTGNILYQWIYSTNGADWFTAPDINYNQSYNWLATAGSYFKRVIQGGGCSDTSNTVYIDVTVLNNYIYTNDTVYCSYENPLPIEGTNEMGYTYQWFMNTGSGWINTGISSYNFTPPAFNNFIEFRRIASFNGCIDSSNIIALYKQNALTANYILINNTDTIKQYCGFAQGNIDGVVSGTVGSVDFIWQISYDLNQWETLPDTTVFTTFTLNDYSSHRYYYYRRIVNQDGCYDTSNVVTIDLLPPIVGNLIQSTLGLGSIAHVCQGTVVWLGSLNVNPAGGTGNFSYHWIQSQDSSSWNNALGPNQFQAYSTPAIYDTIYYARVVTSGVCIDTSNTFAIYPVVLPDNQIAIHHTFFCQGSIIDTIFELVNSQGYNVTYQWQWLNNGNWENISGAVSANYVPAFVLGNRIYRRIIQNGNCYSNSNEITITGNLSPSVNYFLVENDSLCLSHDTLAHIRTHLEGSPPWNILFSVNGNIYNFIQNQPDSEYVININQPKYIISIVQITDASGCDAELSTDSIVIYGFNPINANASSMELCGNSATLQAQNPSPGIGTWIYPSNISINDVHNPNAQVQTSNYGTYTLIWEVVNGPCIDTNHVILSFFEQPQIPDAGVDVTLSENTTVSLQASAPTVGQGTWMVIEGQAVFSDPHNPNTLASHFNEGINILRWIISNGNCPAVFDDIVIKLKNLFVPEGFSPNGDGVNDLFVIHGIESTDVYKLSIFNRWGNIVYEKVPYRNEWDGKDLNNHQLPDDTYFYILEKNNKVKASGYIILKR